MNLVHTSLGTPLPRTSDHVLRPTQPICPLTDPSPSTILDPFPSGPHRCVPSRKTRLPRRIPPRDSTHVDPSDPAPSRLDHLTLPASHLPDPYDPANLTPGRRLSLPLTTSGDSETGFPRSRHSVESGSSHFRPPGLTRRRSWSSVGVLWTCLRWSLP